jgi:predicted transposase YbfD/YdcC
MCIHVLDQAIVGLPEEFDLLKGFNLRLATEADQPGFDQLLAKEHYLKNATVVGRVLRYIAEYEGQWVALLVFSSAAYHLKPRDRWLGWSPRQVQERRNWLAQNSRFLVLVDRGRFPNLSSKVLKMACERLPEDWQKRFGEPVLAVESFVDPERSHGTSYRAAGWESLGSTQGCERSWKDFYLDAKRPKQLWVKALDVVSLAMLQAGQMPEHLVQSEGVLPPVCPVLTEALDSLWEHFHHTMTDPRKARGQRYGLATILTLGALAVAAGSKGPHAIFEFADGLNHGQRRRLRCRQRPGQPRQFDVPSERTFRRMLKVVKSDSLKEALAAWMKEQDSEGLKMLHVDGKVIKNAEPAPAWNRKPKPEQKSEIPLDQQKPKADKALMLVNFMSSDQRLVDQIAVPRDTNEEAAVAAHWENIDLAGVCVTADAAHTTKYNCRQVTVGQGGDYIFALKGNQPHALAKAQQLLPGILPPQAQTLDKEHGRIEDRKLWCVPIDPATVGLAGAAQLIRIQRHVQIVRKGKVIKETTEVAFLVTSLWVDEASPEQLLAWARVHWSIENGQHFRRDRTQDEDRCTVRDTTAARNLSLFRSLAIFLYERQRWVRGGKKSLPDYERKSLRAPGSLINRFMPQAA